MKRRLLKSIISATLALAMIATSVYVAPKQAAAENPIVQTMYTADPAPLVVGDRLYVYTTRDELKETKYDDWSYMNEWRCFSTTDMVNWTDHGQIAHAQTFDKVDSGKENWRAWAHQVVAMPIFETSTGQWVTKYFLYAPFNGVKIDVAVADNPWGPFTDATPGKFLIDGGWGGGNIDPTVLIEDHGNPDDYENYDVYLYWGNPYFRYCKLTNDMVDVDPDTDGDGEISDWENALDPRFSNDDNKILGKVRPGIHSFDTLGEDGYAQFGIPTQGANNTSGDGNKYPTEPNSAKRLRSAFEEGPWVYKHEDGNDETDDYFLVFVGGRTGGETIEYSTAPTPIGPWTYRELLLAREYGNSCDHPGVAEFNGKNYLFFLNDMLVGGDGSNRSVCVKEFEYDEDNLIKKQTPDGQRELFVQGFDPYVRGNSYFSVDPIGTLNPYSLNQAETICWTQNLKSKTGGFNGTGTGVKTKAKEPYEELDPVTGKVAFWKSAAYNGVVCWDIDDSDYIKLREVDFGDREAIAFTGSFACGTGWDPVDTTVDSKGMMIPNPDADTEGGTVEIWIDYEDKDAQKLIGEVEVTETGGTNNYEDFTIDITEPVTGVHDLYFIFKGEEGTKLFNFDTWQFTQKEAPATPTPVVTAPPVATAAPVAQPSAAPSTDKAVPAKAKIKSVKKSGKNAKVTWGKVANATKYQVAVSTKKNSGYKIKLTVKAPKTTGVVKKLKAKKTYYFKVRGVNAASGKSINGKYSAPKKIKL